MRCAWWFRPYISELRKLKQDHCHEFEANLGSRVRLPQKIKGGKKESRYKWQLHVTKVNIIIGLIVKETF